MRALAKLVAPRILVVWGAISFAGSPARAEEPVRATPLLATAPVSRDADDPAIWVCPGDPARSLILGTDKAAAPQGALYVFGLDGQVRHTIADLDRPNNVDVEYGLELGGRRVDIAVVTERRRQALRVFEIEPDGGRLVERSPEGGLPVFEGERGARATPMGIGLYRRPRDGAVFAIVSRKDGPDGAYLWQYHLEDDGSGQVKATRVRAFGRFAGRGEIEAVAVDDALGYVYYAEEDRAIHKWQADPDHPDAGRELAEFGRDGFVGDREGIAIYARDDGTGYIVCTDQINHDSAYRIFRREGEPGRPHDHASPVKVVRGGADSTDGLDVTSCPLGARFPHGLVVAMNSHGRNFLLFSWDEFAAGSPRLETSRGPGPAAKSPCKPPPDR